MKLRLIGSHDVVDVAEGETVFKVRKIPWGELQDIQRRAMVNGRMDFELSRKLEIQAAVVGWKGLENERGEEVEFHADLVVSTCLRLPVSVMARIRAAAQGEAEEAAAALGN